ncbi:MAG: CapA family protein [Clostridia bacterium]|nr:CapA family protein [Clostridia bacterium]
MRKIYFGILLLTLLTLSACGHTTPGPGSSFFAHARETGDAAEAALSGGAEITGSAGQDAAPKEEILIISAVGDIMMHNTQLQSGFQASTGAYDFSSFFTYVQPLLSAADLTIGNLETTFAGEKAGYSGYPRFNTPEVLAGNLQEAGFDILTTANNHCLDKGVSGLIGTLDTLDAAGIRHTGTFRSTEEQEQILLIEKKGVKIAVLSYTYGTNGLKVPSDKPFLVNYLQAERMLADVKKARTEGAQIVIACLHFGLEYQPQPNEEQRQIVRILFDEGVDIILGHHPHVLQPPYIYHYEDAVGFQDKPVIYSLGNFISDQNGLERTTAAILNIHIKVGAQNQEACLEKVSYIPVKTRRFRQGGKLHFEVLPVEAALCSARRQPSYFTSQEKRELEAAAAHAAKQLYSTDPRLAPEPLEIPLESLNLITTW